MALLLALAAFTASLQAETETTILPAPLVEKWVVYYNNTAQTCEFDPYNLIVLDADFHPSITPLAAEEKKVLGYVSLGEVGNYRYYFQDVQDAGLLIAQNPCYPGSWYVDIRKSFWTALMIDTVIPKILEEGFHGILIDALDIPLYLETVNPAAYAGMTQAAVDLVMAIRTAFPDTPLMLNRAYELLSHLGGYIDYAVGDAVYTKYDYRTKQYQYVDQANYQKTVGYLNAAQLLYPNLNVLSLDYWDAEDTLTYSKIYKTERHNGFHPYVSTINLNQIIQEP